jgi:hypothetical protein
MLAVGLALTVCGIGGQSHQPHPVDDGGVHLAAQTGAQPNIIGGRQATEHYPWIVSVERNFPANAPRHAGEQDFHFCTASVFSPHQVVLNAHCLTFDDGSAVDPATLAAEQVHVRVGSNDRFHGGTVLNVIKAIPAPGWGWGVPDPIRHAINDHLIAEVDGDLPQQPLPISPYTAKPNQNVRLMGWGYTDPSGTGVAPQYLQETDTYIEADPHQCDTSVTGDFPLSVGEVCVHNMYGTNGMCYGDSGGPLTTVVKGIRTDFGGASRMGGPGCGSKPMVYTDAAYFRSFDFAIARGETVDEAAKLLPVLPTATHGPGPQAQQSTTSAQLADMQKRWQSMGVAWPKASTNR